MSYDPYNQGQQEDPRYRQQRRRANDPREEQEAQQDGGLGGILGGILGGGQGQQDPQDDPRRSGVISRRSGGGGGIIGMLLSNPRVAMALLMAIGAVVTYFVKNQTETNEITGTTYRVPWEPAKDVPLGLQAAPQMMQQHGGEHPDPQLQNYVERIGQKLVRDNSVGSWAPIFQQYRWDFHLLRDTETVNAFALPGGQVFFTHGLFKKLKTEDEIAGVLGHEIGHVIGRHSAQQMAKNQMISGLVTAGSVATSDGSSQNSGHMAQMIGMMLSTKYGRADESESDKLGVQFMVNAGYNPEGLIRVMEVLKAEMGGQRQPEFMSSHPDPGNRVEAIKQVIQDLREGRLQGPRSVDSPQSKF